MTEHRVGTREEWLAERKALLAEEKELTRRSDELARKRQLLPRVPLDKEYVFETGDGPKPLAELFDGRSQLVVYHFMHGPKTPEGCSGCTFAADHFDGAVTHLAHRDVTFLCASRSPLEVLDAYKRRMGWRFPWVSSGGSDFDRDFAAFTDEEREAGTGFNFGTSRHSDEDIQSEE